MTVGNRGAGGIARRWMAVVALLLLAGAGVAAWWNRDELADRFFRPGEPPAEVVEEAREKAGTIALEPGRAAKMVAQLHARLNDLAGWGRIRSVDWERLAREEPGLTEPLDQLVGATPDPKLKADFQVARELIRRAVAERDSRALLYAHRVLHDLDCRVFEVHCTETYWGYTVSLEGPDNPAVRYLGDDHPIRAYLREQGAGNEQGASAQ